MEDAETKQQQHVAMAHHRRPQEAEEGDISSYAGHSLSTEEDDHEQDEDEATAAFHGSTEDQDDDDDSSSTNKKPLSVMSCLLPPRSLRSTTTTVPVVAQAQTQADGHDDEASAGGIRSLSFSKLFSFRMARAPTLNCIDQLDAVAATASSSSILTRNDEEEEKLKQICRSQSVPTSVRRFNFNGETGKGLMRVADSSKLIGPARLRLRLRVVPLPPPAEATAAAEEDMVAAEEAVCRICMVALSEEEVLKLECWCKGELALAHRDCAIKWFSIKGNTTCDVCSQEVLNLPVTLRRVDLAPQQQQQQQQQADPIPAIPTRSSSSNNRRYSRALHGTPILVIISMLAYFCFLEQLLVRDHGTAALAISLPFACVLGLFSSLTTTKMVSRRYVWIYSAVQFLFIVLFTHLFYRYVRIQAVIAIILSTFAGFSVAICANSLLLQILRWRARRVASPTTTNIDDGEGQGGGSSRAADLEMALPPP